MTSADLPRSRSLRDCVSHQCLAVALIWLATGGATAGQTPLFEDQALTPLDPSAGQLFGRAVAVDGDWAVVGAPFDSELGVEAGAAYVFQRITGTGWVQHTKLLDTDGEAGDLFGFSVAIHVGTIVVGAYNDTENGVRSGSATVFNLQNGLWIEHSELVPSNGLESDHFGWSVAVVAGRIAVAARGVDLPVPGLEHGAVYPFALVGSSWVESPRLTSGSPTSSGEFGFAVSITEGVIAVATRVGRVEVLRENAGMWIPDPPILAPSSPPSGFGIAVAISSSGIELLTGARLDDESALNAGAAYVYLFDGFSWFLEQKLMRASAQENEFLGSDLHLTGDIAVLTAPASSSVLMVQGIGSASVFEREGSTWVETTRLQGSGFGAGEYTGVGTAVSDRRVLLGFLTDDLAGPLSGSVYAYELDLPFERGDCNQDETFTIADPIYQLALMFTGGTPPAGCEDACDSNDDGILDIADPIHLLGYLFVPGSPPPPDPSPGDCGADPTSDAAGCAASACP